MEIPAAIAAKLVEYTVAPIGRQVGYLAHYKRNCQNLQTKLKDLVAARDEVQHKADQVERSGQRVETRVRNWKTTVDEIIAEAESFLKDGRHAHTAFLHGFCSNPVLCYQLSKKSRKYEKEIVELYGQREFSSFAFSVQPKEVCLSSTGNYQAFDSRTSTVMRVMDELRNPETEMILVYGIGGVGKTTLVEEVLRKASGDNLFDDVVMVKDVKENPDLEKIQKEIATKLGMSVDGNHTLAERAPILCERIKQKRTLVVLDDVWKEVDLVAIGVPRLETCKVVVTCRSRKELSSDMRRQKDISVDVLNKEEAWSLFEKMAGDVVKDSRIRSVALEVAKKCGGLPILIVTVARALKDQKKKSVWKDTLRCLRGFDKKELTEKAYLGLEWSYSQLKDEKLKSLFLLCGILVINNHIHLGDLLKYGFGLGLMKDVDTIEEARDALDALVEKLKDSCLLLDSDRTMRVRIHDLVCDVAARIAAREQHVLSVGYGGELKEWPDKEFFQKCSMLSLASTNIPMLSQLPADECQKLELFSLFGKRSSSMEIPSNFFKEMKKLKVMDLTEVRMLALPSSFEILINLQTLLLEGCLLEDVALVGCLVNLEILSFARSDIELLPKEIGQLIRLRWLDLNDCKKLKMISPNVVSRLARLECLTMRNVFLNWEGECGRNNTASLTELKELSKLTTLEIYVPDANILPSNFFSGKLVRYQIYIGSTFRRHMDVTTLNRLELSSSKELDHGIKTLLKGAEDLSLDGSHSVNSIVRQLQVEDFQQLIHLRLKFNVDFTYIIDRKVVFPNLTTLNIDGLNDVNFLLSFSMVKSLVELKRLVVKNCAMMEEIVSTRDQPNGENMDISFRNLKVIELQELPNLVRFCSESLVELCVKKKCDTEHGASIINHTSGINLDGGSGIAVETCLFDGKINFPSLEKLEVDGLRLLQTLWNQELADHLHSFHKLKDVVVRCCESLTKVFVPVMMGRLYDLETLNIYSCNSLEEIFQVQVIPASTSSSPHDHLKPFYCQGLASVSISRCKRLKNIFPASVARGLKKLRSLTVRFCDEVEEIIGGEKGLDTESPKFEFPKVTDVMLFRMPKLCRFYPGMHVSKWPLLKHLSVTLCAEVKILAAEVPMFPEKYEMDPLLLKHSFFLVEKDSFPSLEYLKTGFNEIWYGTSSPTEVFSRLHSICFGKCATPFSKQATTDFLQKLHNLASIEVSLNNSTEVFLSQGINSGEEIQPVGLSGVKTLKIEGMRNLLQLGNGNSQTAGPLFPNLDTLQVDWCQLLKSVESSAVSFRYLTTLKVSNCRRLEYLTSYSVAKSLTQLTILVVEKCDVLGEIIRVSNEDDHDAEGTCEIAFSRLQSVEFSYLTRLHGFCMGNCIVRLPSSTNLQVRWCPIELKISSDGVLFSNAIPAPQEDMNEDDHVIDNNIKNKH